MTKREEFMGVVTALVSHLLDGHILCAMDAKPMADHLLRLYDEIADERAGLLDALKVCGIEPPEHPGEEWTLVTENGPEPMGETAVDVARALMDDCTKADAAVQALTELREFTIQEYPHEKDRPALAFRVLVA